MWSLLRIVSARGSNRNSGPVRVSLGHVACVVLLSACSGVSASNSVSTMTPPVGGFEIEGSQIEPVSVVDIRVDRERTQSFGSITIEIRNISESVVVFEHQRASYIFVRMSPGESWNPAIDRVMHEGGEREMRLAAAGDSRLLDSAIVMANIDIPSEYLSTAVVRLVLVGLVRDWIGMERRVVAYIDVSADTWTK